MPTKIEIKPGDVFNRLTIIKEVPYKTSGGNILRSFLCKCLCGNVSQVLLMSLRTNQTKSCGCLHRERVTVMGRQTDHGARTPNALLSLRKTYESWRSMRQRCLNPKNHNYPRYGGRGVKICDRWREFTSFLQDMGLRPAGKTLDRINVNGNYELGNCKWSTAKEQANNRNTRKVKSTVFIDM